MSQLIPELLVGKQVNQVQSRWILIWVLRFIRDLGVLPLLALSSISFSVPLLSPSAGLACERIGRHGDLEGRS